MDKVLARHVIELNPEDNGGESIILTTTFIANGDPINDQEGVYTNQEIELNSYGNSAAIKLYNAKFTPEFLRK